MGDKNRLPSIWSLDNDVLKAFNYLALKLLYIATYLPTNVYSNFRKITEHEKVLTLKAELEEKLDVWRRQVYRKIPKTSRPLL